LVEVQAVVLLQLGLVVDEEVQDRHDLGDRLVLCTAKVLQLNQARDAEPVADLPQSDLNLVFGDELDALGPLRGVAALFLGLETEIVLHVEVLEAELPVQRVVLEKHKEFRNDLLNFERLLGEDRGDVVQIFVPRPEVHVAVVEGTEVLLAHLDQLRVPRLLHLRKVREKRVHEIFLLEQTADGVRHYPLLKK
jgi:hypothetical protein